MTEREQAIYAMMSPKEKRAIDVCSPELRTITFKAWEARHGKWNERRLNEAWKTKPRRETVDPNPDRRLPPENDDDGRYGT